MGLHEEQLSGRTQQMYFSATEEENFTYPWAYEVDYDKSAEFDAADMGISEINLKIRELMKSGHGSITVQNPRAKHSLGVGILNRLNLKFEGSLGYFGCGLIRGLAVRRRDPRRRPGVQGSGRRARRHRSEGRHYHRRRQRRRLYRLHDAARSHDHPRRYRRQPRRLDV
jgi:hypothetical protein